ncbi:MAG: hypothetical protein ACXAB7_22590, partial [Candidatus Kariarchaeaceae archaeon]
MTTSPRYRNKSYYSKVFRKHWRSISIIALSVFTIPIYIFTALPPVEIVNEVPEEIVEELLVPTVEQIETNKTEQIPVNQTILVPINI